MIYAKESIVIYDSLYSGSQYVELGLPEYGRYTLRRINFKFDTGADVTVVKLDTLLTLGYTLEYLQDDKTCPEDSKTYYGFEGSDLKLRKLTGLTLQIGGFSLINRTIYFHDKVRTNLLGQDIIKNYNHTLIREDRTLKFWYTPEIDKMIEAGTTKDLLP